MIRGRTPRATRTFIPCSRGGSGPANTRRGPSCLRRQNWRTNSAAGPTSPPGRSGHSSATGWPGGFSEEGTYRPDRTLIQASHDLAALPGGGSHWAQRSREGLSMKTSTERILTTHTGSLPRPAGLTDRHDRDAVLAAVQETVERQLEAGVDI